MREKVQILEEKVPWFVRDLEEMFGPSNPNFEFGCIRPAPQGDSPHVHFRNDSSGGVVDICLTEEALQSLTEAWSTWQLAHECLHLIDPHKNPTNVLEEGLATYYQNDKVCRDFAECTGSYAEAEKLVEPFMKTLPDAIKKIRKECRVAIGDTRTTCWFGIVRKSKKWHKN